MPFVNTEKKPQLIQPSDATARRIYWLNNIRTKREDGSLVELKPTPEQMAVAIAKCSRSSTPFDQNIDDVTLEKAAEFHEKWVVGYGHSSVSEHAVASVAFQNIPQIIVKILEDSRLASYTEKSSRYQVFTRDRVGVPETLAQSEFAPAVTALFDKLYGLYDECYDLLKPIMEERCPKGDLPDSARAAVIKAMICDRVRYLLPAASLTSVGMTANARVWEHVIVKLLSSDDVLAQQVGEEIKSVLTGFVHLDRDQALRHFPFPTLLKYANPNAYLASLPKDLGEIARTMNADDDQAGGANAHQPVVCTFDDNLAERRIAASLLVKFGEMSMNKAMNVLAHDLEMQDNILITALEKRGPHDPPPREFEHAWFEHEIVMDYGAWRDIQRHRICTQTNQRLGTDLGFDIPQEFDLIGKGKEFTDVMQEAHELNHRLIEAGMLADSEYVVPMAYRRRMVVSWNLRELFHFIELRSGKKGHMSYRRIAQEVWKSLNASHPLIASFIRVDFSEMETSTLGEKPKGF